MKQLSIIIPTYNMEQYLVHCLESVLVPDILQEIEVIVVNDGSTDSSLAIANGFQLRFPQTVKVIDKPNGNYGSAVNAGLSIAEGRYVKILDADDSFDSVSFSKMVTDLENIDADVVCTHFTTKYKHNVVEKVKYDTMNREPYKYGIAYPLDNILGDGYIRFFLMHSLAYRREMLIEHGYRQSEGISYTDGEWATIPFFYAKDIIFLNLYVYQYNAARGGQTMDSKMLVKSRRELCMVTDRTIEYFRNYDRSLLSETRLVFLRNYIWNKIHFVYRIYLQDMPRRAFDANEFEKVFDRYDLFCQEENIKAKLLPRNLIIRSDNVSYWRKHHKRFPAWYEAIVFSIDWVALNFYRIFIRR